MFYLQPLAHFSANVIDNFLLNAFPHWVSFCVATLLISILVSLRPSSHPEF